MTQDQIIHAARAAIAPAPSFTGLPFTLAAVAVAVREEAHSIAAEAVCALGERSMRPRKSQPGLAARFAGAALRLARKLVTA